MSYLMLDVAGTQLQGDEFEVLQHPAVGGLILFSRNYQSREQLIELVRSVRQLRPELIIAVDHEGGRVQRFRDGFSQIPAMGNILPAAQDMTQALNWAKELGFLMAVELLACDIDLSFAPVLDLDGISEVIGKRAFASDAATVTALARSFVAGMQDSGMAAVGKHFPGHGSVAADTHHAQAVDNRALSEIAANDLQPFKTLIAEGALQGIMPAHVIYPQADAKPAGFSHFWLQQVLRQQLQFNGVIFSDDLGMKGAAFAGDFRQRATAAIAAGCDMVLVCNEPEGARTLLQDFVWPVSANDMLARLRPDQGRLLDALQNESRWLSASALAARLHP
ncbi:beta-N-acetylhexosaminidase [Shewanella fodinae]|uniref:beta-N-acetylhexosaminidase n=1 Tax=Shewanella fodinae TaxID=552357 RepID=UPI0016757606|nr:beta-N-acetylhexosaminidase [Shewanella fodinae]MCL2907642.1 beta-N-acetylhexosaminidase [Shewanella fodinae]GGY99678.1 beta-hexosaminidase [Shewanella fodinae]